MQKFAVVIVVLLVLWAVLSIVGFVLKGLFWLGIIGLVLIVGTIPFGAVQRAGSKR
ncbi:hypothetical protein [Plantibacter sp. H53]|uniref:hypothetical protein n=1 Tax=Plantibacter sp. H53 TaxID=1827323 RepID=UPI000AAB2317|nr:hypothetical protein [Plantibacter sp. H53]